MSLLPPRLFAQILTSVCAFTLSVCQSGCDDNPNLPVQNNIFEPALSTPSDQHNIVHNLLYLCQNQFSKQPPPSSLPQHPKTILLELSRSLAIGAYQGAKPRLSYQGLPKNSRQTKEGYWIGSRPNAEQLQELHARNVKLILSVATIPNKPLRELSEQIQTLGMKQIYLPFGSTFPKPNRFMSDVLTFDPSEIFIHCEHGGDRSGAILAYILMSRHHWPLPKALYSVVVPSELDVNALTRILNRHGIECSPELYSDVIGIYSAESNGGFGGLKVRDSESDGGYYNLIHTLIERSRSSLINPNE